MKPFLDSLSSFWNRLFADSRTLTALYDATFASLGERYLEMLESVLNKSVFGAPVFSKDYWANIVISNSSLYVTGDATYPYGYYLSDVYSGIETLGNSVLSPTKLFERYLDYTFVPSTTDREGNVVSALWFDRELFSSGTGGGPEDGVLYFSTGQTDVVLEEGVGGISNGTTFKVAGSTPVFGGAFVGKKLIIETAPSVEVEATIVSIISSNEVTVDVSLPTATGSRWRVVVTEEQKLSLWGSDVLIDEKRLYLNFGTLVGIDSPSSEAYKELLQGIYLYYTGGPLLKHVEAVINVMHGYPLILTDGEVLTKYETLVDGVNDRVTTTGGVYELPNGVVRDDIKQSSSIGSLVFSAFEPLTNTVTAVDYIKDNTWWWNILLPAAIGGADESPVRRQVRATSFEWTLGTSEYPVKIGDLGLKIGPGPQMRHSYNITNEYMKYHLFGVLVEAHPANLTYDKMLEVLLEGKLSNSYVYFSPYTQSVDSLVVGEIFSYTPNIVPVTDLGALNTTLGIGSGWSIGTYYWYDTPNSISTATGVPNTALGETPVVIGGADPFAVGQSGTGDWPVQVTVV